MTIIVFTDDKRIGRLFKNITRVTVRPLNRLAVLIPEITTSTFLYVDLNDLAKTKLTAFRNAAAVNRCVAYGFIDAAGREKDPADLFLTGARDYLGPALCAKPLTAARIRRATTAAAGSLSAPEKKVKRDAFKAGSVTPHAGDWSSISPGQEYLFRMLFIGLDGYKDINVRVAEDAQSRLLDYFQKRVEQFIAPAGGRLWIWNDFSGIALFPFTKKDDDVAAACLKLMLSRRTISVEQRIQKLLFSFRTVLLTGGTVYRERGRTGRIISDAVNSLSHIGMKFAKPGNCYLSQDVHEGMSEKLKKCFSPAGTFEHVSLMRLKLPNKY